VGHDPQASVASAVGSDGTPTPKTEPKVDTTTTADAVGMISSAVGAAHNTGTKVPEVCPSTGMASADGGLMTTSDDDKLEVVMGHPGLRAPGQVSLFEAMGTTHFALRQA
jgi:hypothetical protein